MPEKSEQRKRLITWIKGLGIGGFLFFLIKGLIWLAVLYGGVNMAGC